MARDRPTLGRWASSALQRVADGADFEVSSNLLSNAGDSPEGIRSGDPDRVIGGIVVPIRDSDPEEAERVRQRKMLADERRPRSRALESPRSSRPPDGAPPRGDCSALGSDGRSRFVEVDRRRLEAIESGARITVFETPPTPRHPRA